MKASKLSESQMAFIPKQVGSASNHRERTPDG
jgi:hypothetical protein